MGRGRFGIGYKRYSHLSITVKEIDFESKINGAPTWSQSQKWKKRKELVDRLRAEMDNRAGTLDANGAISL